MKTELTLSKLGHTWILDLDGTILKHNGYLTDGYDTLLPEAKNFIDNLPNKDMIVIITSRNEEFRDVTETFLKEHNVRYDHIIFNAPHGERILINDEKNSGLQTAHSINISRNHWNIPKVIEDENL